MIFIAKKYDGTIIGIVSAKHRESVNAYFQGKGLIPYKIETFNLAEDRENEQLGFITPILSTREGSEVIDGARRTSIIVENN